MKIFIDTADLDEIRLACSWGIVDGATTNPSLIKRAVEKRGGRITMEEYIAEILKTVPGPVSLEVIALRAKEMIEQARMLYKKFGTYGDAVIKIPINPSMEEGIDDFDGLRAIRQLCGERIPTNATLVMTPEQALLAAKAGATYVSPFAGRVDDYIRERLDMREGVDFKKGDYFDPDQSKRVLERKFTERFGEESSVSKLYLSEELRKILDVGHDNGVYSGVDLVRRILKIYSNYGYKTEVIAASMRNARQVRDVAELGVHIATIPFDVLKNMIRHHKTVEGIKGFTADVVPAYEMVFK